MSERRGFTLVELLLALAILATLLAVAYGGVIQFMQSRSDLEAAINAQAKLRRIVEVFTQDLRSAVFGGLSATPYPSGNASVSFALIEGGAGYPVLPHDSGDNQSFKRATEVKIVVLAEALSDVGIAPEDEVLMVNNLGDGVILPVTDVKPVEGGLEVVHDECGNTIDYTPNTLLFRVRTLGFRFDPTTRRLVYREGREGGGEEVKEVPVAFDMERFEIHYVYEGAFGDTVTDPPGGAFTPGYDFARPTGAPPYQVTEVATGKVYTLRRLSLVLEARFPSRGRPVSRTYTAQVELAANTQYQAKRIVPCE